MSPKWNYIFGATTIALIVGGTIYAIVKSKQVKNAEEDAISLEEAKEIVSSRKNTEVDEELEEDQIHFTTDIEIVDEDDTRIIQGIRLALISDEEDEDEELDEDDPLRDDYPEVMDTVEGPSLVVEPLENFIYYEEGINPKEDKELRYEPNSVEAKHQFVRMELCDWEPNHDVYRIMIQLMEFPFVPTTDGDHILRTQVIDYKVQFFGFNSRWNQEVSFADIILHYARCAEFNCGETVSYWVEHFLLFNDFEWDSTSQHVDTILLRLNNHLYFNDERQTFGLFGLTRHSMDQAIAIANRNIDRSVTYEIEFNEFLKSCV